MKNDIHSPIYIINELEFFFVQVDTYEGHTAGISLALFSKKQKKIIQIASILIRGRKELNIIKSVIQKCVWYGEEIIDIMLFRLIFPSPRIFFLFRLLLF